MKIMIGLVIGLVTILVTRHPNLDGEEKFSFRSSLISESANLWWARAFADVDGNGVLDVILQDNNGSGGWLGYLSGNADGNLFETVIVATETPSGGKFAAGDLEAADLDGDGDLDLIGVEHPGEWTDADAEAILYWYEQRGKDWVVHHVGSIPSALKDIALADLNQDQDLEIVTVTYNAHTLSVFKKSGQYDFEKAWDLPIHNLHEGLDIGDIDGDGLLDIATNGYWLPNPGHLTSAWKIEVIDSIWFSQGEDHWSINATKVFCRDIDEDGMAEVFITHSEKAGYPLAKYDWEEGFFKKEILIESLSAAHSLLVEDLDGDGQYEVLTGVNRNRAINIAEEKQIEVPTDFPVLILYRSAGSWKKQVISTDGVYNLLAGDLEGDGDIDLVRLSSHDNSDMWLLENTLK